MFSFFFFSLNQILILFLFYYYLLLLFSDLGAGKTTFVQSFIRTMLKDKKQIVNSPSYLLDNTYQLQDGSW